MSKWDLRSYEPEGGTGGAGEGGDVDEGLSNQPEDDDDDSQNT